MWVFVLYLSDVIVSFLFWQYDADQSYFFNTVWAYNCWTENFLVKVFFPRLINGSIRIVIRLKWWCWLKTCYIFDQKSFHKLILFVRFFNSQIHITNWLLLFLLDPLLGSYVTSSVRQSVRLWQKFSYFLSLVFLDFLHQTTL